MQHFSKKYHTVSHRVGGYTVCAPCSGGKSNIAVNINVNSTQTDHIYEQAFSCFQCLIHVSVPRLIQPITRAQLCGSWADYVKFGSDSKVNI